MRRVGEVRRVLRMVLLVAVVTLLLQSLLSFFIVNVMLTYVTASLQCEKRTS